MSEKIPSIKSTEHGDSIEFPERDYSLSVEEKKKIIISEYLKDPELQKMPLEQAVEVLVKNTGYKGEDILMELGFYKGKSDFEKKSNKWRSVVPGLEGKSPGVWEDPNIIKSFVKGINEADTVDKQYKTLRDVFWYYGIKFDVPEDSDPLNLEKQVNEMSIILKDAKEDTSNSKVENIKDNEKSKLGDIDTSGNESEITFDKIGSGQNIQEFKNQEFQDKLKSSADGVNDIKTIPEKKRKIIPSWVKRTILISLLALGSVHKTDKTPNATAVDNSNATELGSTPEQASENFEIKEGEGVSQVLMRAGNSINQRTKDQFMNNMGAKTYEDAVMKWGKENSPKYDLVQEGDKVSITNTGVIVTNNTGSSTVIPFNSK